MALHPISICHALPLSICQVYSDAYLNEYMCLSYVHRSNTRISSWILPGERTMHIGFCAHKPFMNIHTPGECYHQRSRKGIHKAWHPCTSSSHPSMYVFFSDCCTFDIYSSPVHRFCKLIKKPPLRKNVVYSILPKKAEICIVGRSADIHSAIVRAQQVPSMSKSKLRKKCSGSGLRAASQ